MKIVERRIAPQPAVLLGVLRVAVLGLPRPADREAVKAQHVEHADVHDRCAEELGMLRQTRTYK